METDSLGKVLEERTFSRANSNAKPNNLTSLPIGLRADRCPVGEFGKAMAHLSAMKRTAQLTKLEMDAWHSVLGVFDPDVLNAAVLEVALNETAFPDLGNLYQSARRHAMKAGRLTQAYSPAGSDKDVTRTPMSELREIGDRFGLPVWRPRS